MSFVYNYAITAIPDENDEQKVAFDVYYFDKETSKMNVVRIVGVYMSFLVCKLPGLSIEQTLEFIKLTAKTKVKLNDFKFEIIDGELKDGSFTVVYTKPIQYVEIFSRSATLLRKLYLELHNMLENDYYKHLRFDDLSPQDQVFILNTESPFRFTEYTINARHNKYFLAQKFNIPFAGYMRLDTSGMKLYRGEHLHPIASKVDKVYLLEANKGNDFHNREINKAMERAEVPDGYETSEMKNIIVASYDIETYNPGEVPKPNNVKQYIFCIGVGFFNLLNSTPFVRYCVISKDLMLDETAKEKLISIEDSSFPKAKLYKVLHEYSDAPNDETTYICVSNEKEVVSTFVDLLSMYNPHVILGFNNFGFDDVAVMARIDHYKDEKLTKKFYQVFSTYKLDDLKEKDPLKPQYRNFELKIEGKTKQTKNETVRAPIIQSVDVYKMILKADAKRFSQSGKLDTMLETYHIHNPFNGEKLHKTGLSISKMFHYWNSNTKLYKIALYCCQDAWITGTLIIERNVLLDKLTYSTITYTTFEDSIYRGDGHRVSCLRSRSGYEYGFAVMNTAYEKRSEKIKDPKIKGLGSKYFDTRTIVGGAVRSVHAARTCGVVAGDFHAQYPSTWIADNLDSSCFVDPLILNFPEKFGFKMVAKIQVNDLYGMRNIYYLDDAD